MANPAQTGPMTVASDTQTTIIGNTVDCLIGKKDDGQYPDRRSSCAVRRSPSVGAAQLAADPGSRDRSVDAMRAAARP